MGTWLPMPLVSQPTEWRPLPQFRSELPPGDACSGPIDHPRSQDAMTRCDGHCQRDRHRDGQPEMGLRVDWVEPGHRQATHLGTRLQERHRSSADNGWFLKLSSPRALASMSIILCGLPAATTKPKIDCRPLRITRGADLSAARHTFQQPSGTTGAGGLGEEISIHRLPFINICGWFFPRGESRAVMESLARGYITPRCRQERQVARSDPKSARAAGADRAQKWT